MSAAAQSGQSVAEQPATPAACAQDYQQHQQQAAVLAGAQRDQFGSAPHTNR